MGAAKEVYKAIVSRVNDPEKRGRIRVQCQSIAAAGVELPFWVEPVFPFVSKNSAGWFAVPEVDSEVEIEICVTSDEDEMPGESFLMHPDVKYRAGAYTAKNPLPSPALKNYPRRRGFVSSTGQYLMFDEKDAKAFLVGALVLLGAEDAAEAFILGTSFRSSQADAHTSMITNLDDLGTYLGQAAADPLLAAVAPTAAAKLLLAAGAAIEVATAVHGFEIDAANTDNFLSKIVKGK
jgi:hypothetical protein